MQTWYECKVKYNKIDQTGHERNVNDTYLLDAVSFTDAEARIYFHMQQIVRGDFQVTNIRKSTISEIIPSESGEWWYKAKISMITIDEEAGKEKKVNSYVLIMADDIVDALKRLEQGLSYLLIPYVTTSVALSNIADVFPYVEGEQALPPNLVPVASRQDQNGPVSEPVMSSSFDDELESVEMDEEPVDETESDELEQDEEISE